MMLPHSTEFEALGTQWRIETAQELSADLEMKIQDRIEKFDQTYSRFRPDSLITEMMKAPGTYTFPPDILPLINLYRSLYESTGGKFTPLIGSTLVRAGYDATYSFQQQPQLPVRSWDDILHHQGTTLTTKQPVVLDFGAAGKGYLVDILAEIIATSGITDFVIDASGDLRHQGSTENRVGLEHPNDPREVIGVVDVRNQSLCSSSGSRRRWGNGLHHIFNPDTQAPVDDIIATWVIADSTLIADGIATALFMSEPDTLLSHYTFAYIRMHADQSVDYSHELEGALFS